MNEIQYAILSSSSSLKKKHLLQSGSYTVEITAINPLFNAKITKTIQIMEPIENIRIDDGGVQTDAYVLKKFNMTFTYAGTDSCVVVNFGDNRGLKSYGHKPTCDGSASAAGARYESTINGTSIEIEHTYTSTGTFTVQADGFNVYSSASCNFTHVISNVDCTVPRLGIKNRREDFTNPASSKRSERLNIVGVTDINCAHTLNNDKQWLLYKVDPMTGKDSSEVIISTLPSRNKAELSLAPLFLDLGLYRAEYSITMQPDSFDKNETFSSNVDHFVEIIASDLVVRVFPGGTTKINRGESVDITIDPESYSYDPDMDSNVPQVGYSTYTILPLWSINTEYNIRMHINVRNFLLYCTI